MPIILRRRVTFPMMQPDNTFQDKEFATVAFVDASGQQYAQVNIEASEVESIEDGTTLAFSITEPHDLTMPENHDEMALASK